MRTSGAAPVKVSDSLPAKAGGRNERRRRPRAKIRQRIRIRSGSVLESSFEEVTHTINVSRGGVYFVTRRDYYRPGLHVMALCPYNPSEPVGPTDERRAEIVRVESLPGGLRGIALSFDQSLEVLP